VVHGLTDTQREEITEFLQDAVDAFCNENHGEWFWARTLVGGENGNWRGTPLAVLFRNRFQVVHDHDAAHQQAGIDVGWILKRVLEDDRRTFKTNQSYGRRYRLVG